MPFLRHVFMTPNGSSSNNSILPHKLYIAAVRVAKKASLLHLKTSTAVVHLPGFWAGPKNYFPVAWINDMGRGRYAFMRVKSLVVKPERGQKKVWQSFDCQIQLTYYIVKPIERGGQRFPSTHLSCLALRTARKLSCWQQCFWMSNLKLNTNETNGIS